MQNRVGKGFSDFLNYDVSTQTIVEPLSYIELVPTPTNPGGSNSVWVDSDTGHINRGDVDLETQAAGSVTGPDPSKVGTIAVWADPNGLALEDSDCTASGYVLGCQGVTFEAVPQLFNITPQNNEFRWNDGSDYYVIVPTAQYTGAGLALKIQDLVNASGSTALLYSSLYTANSFSFEFTTAVSLRFATPDYSIASTIGFSDANTASLTTHTGAVTQSNGLLWVDSDNGDLMFGNKNVTTDTLTGKTITAASNTVAANSLKTTTGEVSVSGSAAPLTGMVLKATSSTTAEWSSVINPVLGGLSFSGGVTPVSVSCPISNTWNSLTGAAGTLTGYTISFTQPVDGRLQYTGSPMVMGFVSFSLNMSGGSTVNWYARLTCNDATITSTSQQRPQGSTYVTLGGTYPLDVLNPGDTFDIQVMSTTSGVTALVLSYSITVFMII